MLSNVDIGSLIKQVRRDGGGFRKKTGKRRPCVGFIGETLDQAKVTGRSARAYPAAGAYV